MHYESMLKKDWYTLDTKPIPDIKKAIREATWGQDKVVIIGTDSQLYDKRLEFATSIVIYTMGKGGRVFYTKTFTKPAKLRKKLVDEAWLSIYTAWEVEPLLPSTCDLGSVHVDVNPDPKEASSQYYEEIYWLVKGQGFQVVTKPLAFASSHISEHIVKRRNEGRVAV